MSLSLVQRPASEVRLIIPKQWAQTAEGPQENKGDGAPPASVALLA